MVSADVEWLRSWQARVLEWRGREDVVRWLMAYPPSAPVPCLPLQKDEDADAAPALW